MKLHVAMIIDEDRLTREHVMLRRLAIGLVDSGVRLTRVVPDCVESESVLSSERRLGLVPRIEVPLKVLPWRRTSRAGELASVMERSLPDVIYAVGRGTWALACDLADLIERPVALDVWSAELAHTAPRKRAARNIGCYIAPTSPIAELLRKRVDPHLVSLVPMGVAIPTRPPPVLAHHPQSVTAAIAGSGRDMSAYRGLLKALKAVLHDLPQLQVVIELRGPHEHDIWRELDRLNLHHAVSPIQDASLHRPLITRCDALIMPECYGETGSLLLECMAAGMVIAAREDPMLDMLEHGKNAVLLAGDDMPQWGEQLLRCLGDAQHARSLGSAAREVARSRHSSSTHISRLIETFARMVSGENYTFALQEA